MADKQSTNWTTIIIVVVLILLAYVLWDAYITPDPLTKVAQKVDSAIDTTSEVVTDTADKVYGATANVVGGVVRGTERVVGGVVRGTQRVLVGAVNAVGDSLIWTGEAIRIERDGSAKLIAPNGQTTEISAEEAQALMEEDQSIRQEAVEAAANAGVSSPIEGEMNQNVDKIVPSEDGEESVVMDISRGVDAGVPPAGVPPAEPVLDEKGNVLENFYYYYDYPRYCTECGGKGRNSCNNCENCGFCITPNGNGECVSGDANGPYFREDCIAYEHSANGYRIYQHTPYRRLIDLPYWKRSGYYHDLRGYPRTRYTRRRGDQHRRQRNLKAARRAAILSK